MSNYRELSVWQRSRTLAREVYAATKTFPKSELFGLTHQMRKAATSIPSNIAEGHGRWTRRDCIRFLHMARGSAFELDTQLFIAEDLEFLTAPTATALREHVGEVARMLNGLIRYYEKLINDTAHEQPRPGTKH